MDRELGPIGTNVLFENEHVKVWHLSLEPGQASPWHQHERVYMYVVTEPGYVQTERIDGTVVEQRDHLGDAVMMERDIIHRLVNKGSVRYSNVIIEMKK